MTRDCRAVRTKHTLKYSVSDLEEGESISKDEVHGAFNVAVFVVMPADVVVERVLATQELAAKKRRGVARYP